MTEMMAGRFVVGPDGRVEPDQDLRALLRRLDEMEMCLGGDGRMPYFWYSPESGMYWEHIEFEDGQVTLRRVTRDWIERNWPSVNCDKRVKVPRS